MLRLLLLRHAKSDWGDKSLGDLARPLNARGRSAAPRIGAYMRAKKYIPDIMLCSTSQRTRETLELLLPALVAAPEVRYVPTLYLAEWSTLLEAVHALPVTAATALLIGHNPGTERLARELLGKRASPAERVHAENLTAKFPTGALAVFEFPHNDWRMVRPGAGRLVDFVTPKGLPAARMQGKANPA